MFDAEDWLARMKEEGGTAHVEVANLLPKKGVPLSPECEAIWAELQGPENVDKWRAVHALVLQKVGPLDAGRGWGEY